MAHECISLHCLPKCLLKIPKSNKEDYILYMMEEGLQTGLGYATTTLKVLCIV